MEGLPRWRTDGDREHFSADFHWTSYKNPKVSEKDALCAERWGLFIGGMIVVFSLIATISYFA